MELDGSYDTDTDEEILLDLEEDILVVFTISCTSLMELFHSNGLEEGGQTTVNHNIGVNDILALVRSISSFV